MVGLSWKKYFNLNQFSLVHDKPVTFILSQWQFDQSKPSILYCLFRICMFSTFFVSWIFSIATERTFDGSSKWAIYLTNWGYTICTFQSLLVCLMTFISYISKKEHIQETTLKVYPVYWLFNIIAVPVAFTITIIYWSLIYNAEDADIDAMNMFVHGCNSILMMLDLWIVSHPLKFFHFIYPLALAFIYAVFTYIYYVAGGVSKNGTNYIYPIIRWDKPGSTTLVCLAVMVLMICLHILSYGIFLLRIKLYECISAKRRGTSKSPSLELKKNEHSGITTEAV